MSDLFGEFLHGNGNHNNQKEMMDVLPQLQQQQQQPKNQQVLQQSKPFQFIPPPIKYVNKTYCRTLEDNFDDQVRRMTTRLRIFHTFRSTENLSANLQPPLRVDQEVKQRLRNHTKGILRGMMESIRTMTTDTVDSDPKAQVSKMINKSEELLQMCTKIKLAEATQSAYSIMAQETKILRARTTEMKAALQELREQAIQHAEKLEGSQESRNESMAMEEEKDE